MVLGDWDGGAGIVQKAFKVRGQFMRELAEIRAVLFPPHASQFLVFTVSRKERGGRNWS